MSKKQSIKQTQLVGFMNQKGGAGKSTATMLVASYLQLYTDMKICVLDLDPQNTIVDIRNEEIEEIANGNAPKRLRDAAMALQHYGKEPFRIISIDIENKSLDEAKRVAFAIAKVDAMVAKGEYDLIFVDLPGYVDSAPIYSAICKLNFVFIPFQSEKKALNGTLRFIQVLEQIQHNVYSFKAFALFSSNDPKNEQTVIDYAKEIFRQNNYTVLDNCIYKSNVVKNDTSTIAALDLKKDRSIEPFINEVLGIIQKTLSK